MSRAPHKVAVLTRLQALKACVGTRSRLMTLRGRAQNVVEYGLLIVSIVVAVLLGVARFGTLIEPWFAKLAGHVTTVGT
jgi:Flp pilus assembly pilin Flp